jgi:hypothetical protein
LDHPEAHNDGGVISVDGQVRRSGALQAEGQRMTQLFTPRSVQPTPKETSQRRN